MKFVPPNDPILTKVAKEILKNQINSFKTSRIVEVMIKVAHGQRKDRKKPIMVGLAAPQIGKSIRIILVDVKADGKGPLRPRSEARKAGKLRVYINPKIVWKSKKQQEWYEGCYSTSKVCGIVKRPTSIKISAYVLGFKPSQPLGFKATGYVARIFQHEIDHLNGKVFVDKIKDPDKLHWVLKKEFPYYRNREAWRNWPKKCSFDRWKKIQKTGII